MELPDILQKLPKGWLRGAAHGSIRIQEGEPITSTTYARRRELGPSQRYGIEYKNCFFAEKKPSSGVRDLEFTRRQEKTREWHRARWRPHVSPPFSMPPFSARLRIRMSAAKLGPDIPNRLIEGRVTAKSGPEADGRMVRSAVEVGSHAS